MPQDFSHQNLRGRSFKGQDLAGANFSYADIKGADFTGANLRGANFTGAKAGLQNYSAAILLSLLALLATISGFAAVFTGIVFGSSLLNRTNDFFAFLIALLCLVIFCIVFIRESVTKAFGVFITVFALSGFLSVAFMTTKAWLGSGALGGSVVFTLASVVGASITGSLLLSIAVFVRGITAFISIVIAAAFGVLTGSYFLVLIAPEVKSLPLIWLWVAIMTVVTSILSTYTSWQIIIGNKTYSFLRAITIAFASTGSTSFRNADLTDANFTQATLKNTDFTKANLTRTCWYQAKKLDFANVSKTYLQELLVQRLLVTVQGINQNFDGLNLRGINLKGANLTDASFIGADLSQANLQNADLTRAKLVQTQLDGTDFTGANLTGAYIEDWNITTDTKFDGVRCEYVYMRLPTPDNPDPHRKPDNRQEVFADGEFGDFIKPIFDTLDLYHNQGVDPRAIAISFKQLAENHPQADLRIVGMEVRGEDKFLLRAKTAIAANKSELSAEYFATYNQLKALAEQEVKALIAEKDGRIAELQNMVVTALQRPSFYSNVEQVGFMTNNPGGFSVGGSVSGDINNVQGDNNQQRVNNKTSNFNLKNAQFGGGLVNAENVTANQIGGNITNYNPEQKQNLAQAAAEIQQLLNQLSQSYPTATTLEKMTVVAKAVDEIENNPTLKARVIGALKAGGTEAFKELIDNPLVNILLASIEGWQDAE